MSEQLDPFGDNDEPEQHKTGYSIATGSAKDTDASEEAQGRRAIWHLRRIRQVERLKEVRRGALNAEIAALEQDLADARAKASKVDQWAEEQTRVDRALLFTWESSAAAFNDPDRPRQATVDFGAGFALASEMRTTPQKLNIGDEAVVMKQFPDYVVAVPKLEWARLKKSLVITPEGVLSADGEYVQGVWAEPRRTEMKYFALIDGKKIALQGGQGDGTGTEFDSVGDHAEFSRDDDPFGDDA